jgi:phosphoglycolate phosphatase-like HAD superfamily hydrolase
MVILFDIDGTLISTGGAGRRAYEAAFAQEFGEDHGLLEFSFSGMTDPLLIRRGLEAAEREVTPAIVDAMVERYLEHLPATLQTVSTYTVYPGVDDIVPALADRPDLALGLGTGNVEQGARLKLEPAGLNDYFAFGGFGSDAEDRAEILRAGAERGAAQLGCDVATTRVVVIGDTPRDIDAARRIGAQCIAVDTGSTDTDAIREAGPDLFVPDLRDGRLESALSKNK